MFYVYLGHGLLRFCIYFRFTQNKFVSRVRTGATTMEAALFYGQFLLDELDHAGLLNPFRESPQIPPHTNFK